MTDLQERILSIFKEVSALCEREGLRYFAIGGTCIGAVRHKGFIPWDDDLDIAMPIEDFDRFVEMAETKLPPYLKILSGEKEEHYARLLVRVLDERTTFQEARLIPYGHSAIGVFIDVMPMSGVPAERLARWRFVFLNKLYNSLDSKHRFPRSHWPTLKARIWWTIVHPFVRGKPVTYYSRKWMALLREHPFDKEEMTGYTWSERLPRLIFPKEWFASYVKFPFEDTEIRCPVNWDAYLTQHWGDYMKLPPEKDRVNKHMGEGGYYDLTRSYHEVNAEK